MVSVALIFLHAALIGEKGKDHICYEGAPGCLHIEGLVQQQWAKALDLHSSAQLSVSALVKAETLGWQLPAWVSRI